MAQEALLADDKSKAALRQRDPSCGFRKPAIMRLSCDLYELGLEILKAWREAKDPRLTWVRKALAKHLARELVARSVCDGHEPTIRARAAVKAGKLLARKNAPLSPGDVAEFVRKRIEDARFVKGLEREILQSGPLPSESFGTVGARFAACVPAEDVRVGRTKALLETVSSKTVALTYPYVETDRRSCAVLRIDLDLAKHGIRMASLQALYAEFQDLYDAGLIVDLPNFVVPRLGLNGEVISAHVLWMLPENMGVWCDQRFIDDPKLTDEEKPRNGPIILFRSVYIALVKALAHLGADASAPGMCPRVKNPLSSDWRAVSWSSRFHSLARWAGYLDVQRAPLPETAPLAARETVKLVEGSLSQSIHHAMFEAAYPILTGWHTSADPRWVDDRGRLGYNLTEELERLFGDVDAQDALETVRREASKVGHVAAKKFDIRRARTKSRRKLADKMVGVQGTVARQRIAAAESALANRSGSLNSLFLAMQELAKSGPVTKAALARLAGVCRQTVYNLWDDLMAMMKASKRLPAGCLKRSSVKMLGSAASVARGAVVAALASPALSAPPVPALSGAPVLRAASQVVALPSPCLRDGLDVQVVVSGSSDAEASSTGSMALTVQVQAHSSDLSSTPHVGRPDGPAPVFMDGLDGSVQGASRTPATPAGGLVVDHDDGLGGAVQGIPAASQTSTKETPTASSKPAKAKTPKLSKRVSLERLLVFWKDVVSSGLRPTIQAIAAHAGVVEGAVAARWVDVQYTLVLAAERQANGTPEGSLPRKILKALMAEASGEVGDREMLAKAAEILVAEASPTRQKKTPQRDIRPGDDGYEAMCEVAGERLLARLDRRGKTPTAMDSVRVFLSSRPETDPGHAWDDYEARLLRERWEAYRDRRERRHVPFVRPLLSAVVEPPSPAPPVVYYARGDEDEDDDSDERDLAAIEAHTAFREADCQVAPQTWDWAA